MAFLLAVQQKKAGDSNRRPLSLQNLFLKYFNKNLCYTFIKYMQSKNNNYDLVVLGGGAGGLSTAAGAARFGLKVLLVEKNKLGGDCLWVGCIPSKTLIHEADKMRSLGECGMDIFENIKTEAFQKEYFEKAKDRIKMVQAKIAEHDSAERFEEMGVRVVNGAASFVNKNTIKVNTNNGEEIFTFKKCVIATGSCPFVPDIFKAVKYYTNEEIFDITELPAHLIVIGGGSIGIEIASAFILLGSKVSIIQRESTLMSREEKEVSDFMKAQLTGMGIKVYTNTNILEVKNASNEISIKFEEVSSDTNNLEVEKLSVEREVLGSHMFVATGRAFNTEIGLENANIKYSKKGIEIDDYLKTTNKNVYAIGDVNGKMLFTHAAGYQAKAVLQNLFTPGLLFFLKKKSLPEAFPWVTYTYPEVAHVGAYTRDLDMQKVKYKNYITPLESVDRARTGKVHKDGFIQILVGGGGKILGVTIVSPSAGELITEWVLAIQYKLPVEAIYNTVHAYPTLSELNPRGTFAYMSEKLSPSVQKIVKIIFKVFN